MTEHSSPSGQMPPICTGDLWQTRDWLRGERNMVLVQGLRVREPIHNGSQKSEVDVVIKAINPIQRPFTSVMTTYQFWRFYEPLTPEPKT